MGDDGADEEIGALLRVREDAGAALEERVRERRVAREEARPRALRRRGGVVADAREQEGALEVDKGAFTIEPFLYVDDTLVTWNDVALDHELEEGYLPIPSVIWRRGAITLRQLLQMSDGLRFSETYGNPLGDVLTMLFGTGDAAGFAAAKRLAAEPGTRWSYASGTTNIIARGLGMR